MLSHRGGADGLEEVWDGFLRATARSVRVRSGSRPGSPSIKRVISSTSSGFVKCRWNGDRFTVAALGANVVSLTDGRRQVELPSDKPLHLDHAYATTVHSSQGTTAERVLIEAATKTKTTSKDVFYVAISRAQREAHVYTDDAAKLPIAVDRERQKHAALDLERR